MAAAVGGRDTGLLTPPALDDRADHDAQHHIRQQLDGQRDKGPGKQHDDDRAEAQKQLSMFSCHNPIHANRQTSFVHERDCSPGSLSRCSSSKAGPVVS